MDRWRDRGAELIDLIFRVVGPRARGIRLWSSLVLVLAALLGLGGAYMFLGSTTPTLEAAQIEKGYRPSLTTRTRRGSRRANQYQITGKLAHGDSIVFANGDTAWRCAPLVSDFDRQPRVYYAASERSYRRSRDENYFAGDLYTATASFFSTARYEAEACGVPQEAYVLVDDGSLRAWAATGRSLLTIAFVIGLLAAGAFGASIRKEMRK